MIDSGAKRMSKRMGRRWIPWAWVMVLAAACGGSVVESTGDDDVLDGGSETGGGLGASGATGRGGGGASSGGRGGIAGASGVGASAGSAGYGGGAGYGGSGPICMEQGCGPS